MSPERADFEVVWANLRGKQGRAGELRELFDRTLVPMVWLDNRRFYVDANAASRLFLRRTLREIVRLRADDLVPGGEMPMLEAMWTTLLGDGTAAGTIEIRVPDGLRVSVDYCGVANMLPGAHLFVWMPSNWPSDELGRLIQKVPPPASGQLTTRERDVLSLLARGADVQGIAQRLSLSPNTVKTHLRRALKKLGARHRAHAIAIALREGEIQLDLTRHP